MRSIAKPASAAASFTVSSPATACRDDEALVATSQPGATTAIAGYSALVDSQALAAASELSRKVGAEGTPSVNPASAASLAVAAVNAMKSAAARRMKGGGVAAE